MFSHISTNFYSISLRANLITFQRLITSTSPKKSRTNLQLNFPQSSQISPTNCDKLVRLVTKKSRPDCLYSSGVDVPFQLVQMKVPNPTKKNIRPQSAIDINQLRTPVQVPAGHDWPTAIKLIVSVPPHYPTATRNRFRGNCC